MPDIKRVDRSMRDFAHGNELGRRFWCTKIPLDTPLAGLVTADPAFAVIESDLLQGMTGLWSDRNQGSSERLGQCPASALRVESRCDAVALGSNISVSAPFVWRCLTGSTMAPFSHPAHRTGQADFPHPALGQDFTPSPTTRRAQAGIGLRARSARRDARVDRSRPCVA